MSEVYADTWSWLKLDNLPKPTLEEEIERCKHPFDILLKDEYGYWNCMCGATGNLVTDYDRKLRFSIPRDNKTTRQQRRKWERTVMKEFVKSQKRKSKSQPKITT